MTKHQWPEPKEAARGVKAQRCTCCEMERVPIMNMRRVKGEPYGYHWRYWRHRGARAVLSREPGPCMGPGHPHGEDLGSGA